MIVENGRIIPLIIAVGRTKGNWHYRYAVTLPWFSTWVDISDWIHTEEKINVHHPIVAMELQDAVARLFDFFNPTTCCFYDKDDDPRLWGSI